jgi:hypothetical protein
MLMLTIDENGKVIRLRTMGFDGESLDDGDSLKVLDKVLDHYRKEKEKA